MMNNPSIFQGLLADPLFQIENHGWSHQLLSVTGRSAYGIAGTCFTDDVVTAAAQFMGQGLVSFSINVDGGASYPASTVFSETIKAGPGDIVISHMNHPGGGTAPGYARDPRDEG